MVAARRRQLGEDKVRCRGCRLGVSSHQPILVHSAALRRCGRLQLWRRVLGTPFARPVGAVIARLRAMARRLLVLLTLLLHRCLRGDLRCCQSRHGSSANCASVVGKACRRERWFKESLRIVSRTVPGRRIRYYAVGRAHVRRIVDTGLTMGCCSSRSSGTARGTDRRRRERGVIALSCVGRRRNVRRCGRKSLRTRRRDRNITVGRAAPVVGL